MSAEEHIPNDAALPALERLFAGADPPAEVMAAAQTAGAAAHDAVSLSYSRYWPGRRAVAQWTFESVAGRATVVSAETRPGAAELRTETFPKDRVLAALETVVSPQWLRETLAPLLGLDERATDSLRWRPLSYKSWRRCVVEYSYEDGGRRCRVYGKLFRDDRGARLQGRLQALEAALQRADGVWRVPHTIGYLPRERLLLQAELDEADSLSELTRRAPEDSAVAAAVLASMRLAAGSLGELQQLELPDLPERGAADLLIDLAEDIESMARVEPAAARRLRRALGYMQRSAERLEPEAWVLSHGAFRHSHVYPLGGGKLGLLDLDNLGMAGASADAGYFLAYLRFAALNRPRLRPFLAECERSFRAGLTVEEEAARQWRGVYMRAILAKWALRCFFSLERDWRETLEGVLEACRQIHADEMGSRPRDHSTSTPLQRAADRTHLAGLARRYLLPRFFPSAARLSLRDVETLYEPGRECVVQATLRLENETERQQQRVVFTLRDEGLAQAPGVLASAPQARYVFAPEDGCLMELFPTDYLVPGLAVAMDPRHVSALLASAGRRLDGAALQTEVLRYRPHERCVLRYREAGGSGGQLVAKVYDDPATAEEVWTTLRALRSQLDRPGLVVEPFALDADNAIVLMEYVEGLNLGNAMDASTDEAEMRSLTAAAAAALAWLHGLSLQHERVKTYEGEAFKLRQHASAIRPIDPDLAQSVDAVLDAVDARASGMERPQPSFVHGGFKPTQLLQRQGGVSVVDFDGSCLGDPALDVGRFMAKLRADALDPARAHLGGLDGYFLEQYVRAGGRDLSARVAVYQAMALVRMAARRFQTAYASLLHRGRPTGSQELLELARASLEARY